MLLTTTVQKFFFKLLSLLIAAFYSINGALVPPSEQTPIQAKNPDEVKLVFATIADPQMSNYILSRVPTFQAACMDLKNAECKLDAVVGAGDIAENGLAEEYQLIYDNISGIDTRYIMAIGNHDVRLRNYKAVVSRFTGFINALNGDNAVSSLHYSETINGYKIIVLGTDRTEFEESYLSDSQLAWLDAELEAANGEPAFVVCHQPLRDTHNVDVAWNSPIDGAGTVGKQSAALREILVKHKNVIYINGHLHEGLGAYSFEKLGEASYSVNVPSFSVGNSDGEYNDAGTGFIVEVYDGEVIFRARDFAKGIWVPEYDITIPVAKK